MSLKERHKAAIQHALETVPGDLEKVQARVRAKGIIK